jgi:spermidine/putrescine transport system permease protein
MIRTLPTSNTYNRLFTFYVILYFIFLFAPLLVTCVLAFNDSQFPSLPWKGFTLDWFTANSEQRVGIFHDRINLDSIWVSFRVAFFVTLLSTAVGTCGAFLLFFDAGPAGGSGGDSRDLDSFAQQYPGNLF